MILDLIDIILAIIYKVLIAVPTNLEFFSFSFNVTQTKVVTSQCTPHSG